MYNHVQPCKHDELSMVGYKEETNANYCRQGCYMDSLCCSNCKSVIVANGYSKKGQQFKPTALCPAFCCINAKYNVLNDEETSTLIKCKHAYCGECFKIKQLECGTKRSSRSAMKNRIYIQQLKYLTMNILSCRND
jgi:hypothetical protein